MFNSLTLETRHAIIDIIFIQVANSYPRISHCSEMSGPWIASFLAISCWKEAWAKGYFASFIQVEICPIFVTFYKPYQILKRDLLTEENVPLMCSFLIFEFGGNLWYCCYKNIDELRSLVPPRDVSLAWNRFVVCLKGKTKWQAALIRGISDSLAHPNL